jgi:hypothetical protein
MSIPINLEIALNRQLRVNAKNWPKSILEFKGEPDIEAFESHRDELILSVDDPFAEIKGFV